MTKIWHITTGTYLGLFIGGALIGAHVQWLVAGCGLVLNILIAIYHAEEEA